MRTATQSDTARSWDARFYGRQEYLAKSHHSTLQELSLRFCIELALRYNRTTERPEIGALPIMKNDPMITGGSGVLTAILFSTALKAQNFGIGVSNPQSKLSINGTPASGGLAIGDATYDDHFGTFKCHGNLL